MIDEQLRDAFAPFREVEVSFDLPSPVPAGRRSVVTPRRLAVGAMAAAAALVVGTVVLDDPPNDVQAHARSVDLGAAELLAFDDGTTVDVDELFDVANHERLQALFAEHGAELVIGYQPVTQAREGQVLDISIPAGMADEEAGERITLIPGGRVEVTVGREGMEPLRTLFEVFPEVLSVTDSDDPVATGEALKGLGFKVRWVHITGPGEGGDVASPPPGTVVLSILGPNGEWDDIDPTVDTLMVEVATPEVAASLGH